MAAADNLARERKRTRWRRDRSNAFIKCVISRGLPAKRRPTLLRDSICRPVCLPVCALVCERAPFPKPFRLLRCVWPPDCLIACKCVYEIHFWCCIDDHRTFKHVYVLELMCTSSCGRSDVARSIENIVAQNHYKEPTPDQQKVHSVTNPVFEQLSKHNELLYSGKLRVLHFWFSSEIRNWIIAPPKSKRKPFMVPVKQTAERSTVGRYIFQTPAVQKCIWEESRRSIKL